MVVHLGNRNRQQARLAAANSNDTVIRSLQRGGEGAIASSHSYPHKGSTMGKIKFKAKQQNNKTKQQNNSKIKLISRFHHHNHFLNTILREHSVHQKSPFQITIHLGNSPKQQN